MSPSKPKVSVIVATRNSANTLVACLTSIRRQTYKPVELLVVDNDSTDQTRAIAADCADEVITFGPERSAQRNKGAAESSGEYLLFIDHDMRLEQNVIAECVAAGTDSDALIIPEFSFGSGFLAKARALERSCYVGDDDIEAARFYKRPVFDALGGFDPELIAGGEDWDLHARALSAGYRIARVDALIGHDEGKITTRDTIKKRLYYGSSFALYRKKNPERAKRQFSMLRPAFLRNWKRLAAHPLLTAGFLYLKAIEFISGLVGAGRRPA